MRVDIPFQMFEKLDGYSYTISGEYEVRFVIGNEWYLSDHGLLQCLYGPCEYCLHYENIEEKKPRYSYGVPWINKLITVSEWLEEIVEVLEGKR